MFQMPLQKQPKSLFSSSFKFATTNVNALCERAERRLPGVHLRQLRKFFNLQIYIIVHILTFNISSAPSLAKLIIEILIEEDRFTMKNAFQLISQKTTELDLSKLGFPYVQMAEDYLSSSSILSLEVICFFPIFKKGLN